MKVKSFFIVLISFLILNINCYSQDIKEKSIDNIEQQQSVDVAKPYINGKKIEDVYTRPYSLMENNIEASLLKRDTLTMFAGTFVGVGVLYLLPESFTNWDKDDASNIFKKWKKNVSDGPVMDEDDFFLNYVTHPYWGAVYYMTARSAGANIFYSFGYSVLLSTFFWEYGVEAFAEIPSKQDLIITPVVGSLFGEGFYLAKRHILNNEYKLLNSTTLGHVTIFLMDPITEITKWFMKDYRTKVEENHNVALFSYPTFNNNGFGYNINFSMAF